MLYHVHMYTCAPYMHSMAKGMSLSPLPDQYPTSPLELPRQKFFAVCTHELHTCIHKSVGNYGDEAMSVSLSSVCTYTPRIISLSSGWMI